MSRRADRGCARPGYSRAERTALLLLALTLAVCAVASRPHTPDTSQTARVRVNTGDTLWAIAQRNQIEGMTTQQTADLIGKLNRLGSSGLIAGSEIMVPVCAQRGALVRMSSK